jgi:hypothetical protein
LMSAWSKKIKTSTTTEKKKGAMCVRSMCRQRINIRKKYTEIAEVLQVRFLWHKSAFDGYQHAIRKLPLG